MMLSDWLVERADIAWVERPGSGALTTAMVIFTSIFVGLVVVFLALGEAIWWAGKEVFSWRGMTNQGR